MWRRYNVTELEARTLVTLVRTTLRVNANAHRMYIAFTRSSLWERRVKGERGYIRCVCIRAYSSYACAHVPLPASTLTFEAQSCYLRLCNNIRQSSQIAYQHCKVIAVRQPRALSGSRDADPEHTLSWTMALVI